MADRYAYGVSGVGGVDRKTGMIRDSSHARFMGLCLVPGGGMDYLLDVKYR